MQCAQRPSTPPPPLALPLSICPHLQIALGILAVGSMMATSINKTAAALGGALNNYATNAMNRSPPMSEPLTLSKAYVSR